MREMKDSGIEWIGEIPQEWNIARLRDIKAEKKYAIVDGPFGSSISTNDYKESGIPLIRITNLKNGEVTENDMVYISEELAEKVGRSSIGLSDIVFAKTGATIGKCGVNKTIKYGILASSCVKISISHEFDHRFFYYIFLTDQFNEALRNTCTGTTRDTINLSPFSKLNVVIPPYKIQHRIADYLDRKCSQIDAIIARQQEVIEKLKAYKLSVITEAVTKGLNPDVPMKNSGVEWIGEIPEQWKVCRLKNVLQQIKNAVKVGPFGSQLKTNDYVDTGYWVYTQRTVLDKNFDSNDTFISCEKYRDMEGFKVEADDILITTRGTGTTGHIAKVPPNFFEGILHPCLMRIKLDESICKYDYLFYLFEYAAFIRNQIDFASNTSSLPVLYSYTLNNIWITLPSVNEQLQIATALKEVAAKIDNIIIKRQQVIDSLIDYKKSLIYEVVTGKKEV